MIQAIVCGLAAITCAAIGRAVTFYIQSSLRKEKLKELLYREKLAAYKEIAELGFKVWYGCLDLSLDHNKMKDLAGYACRLHECKDKSLLFIFGRVEDELKKFLHVTTLTETAIMELPRQSIEDLTLEEHPTRKIELCYYRLVNEMRHDLGIEALSESLLETYEFVFKGIKR